jgi:hypothetical protein
MDKSDKTKKDEKESLLEKKDEKAADKTNAPKTADPSPAPPAVAKKTPLIQYE